MPKSSKCWVIKVHEICWSLRKSLPYTSWCKIPGRLTSFVNIQMTKVDNLFDASGLLAKKVADVGAVVILTFYLVVDEDYSPAHAIASSWLDHRASRNSIFDAKSDHINLFLSVSWIRTYLKSRWIVSFQRTVKLKNKATDVMINPYSIKFDIYACHRVSFGTEKEVILAIKSLSHDLLLEYQSNHRKCEISDTSYSLVSKPVSVQHESLRLSSKIINQVIPDIPEKTFKIKGGRKLFSSTKLKRLLISLRKRTW